MSKFKVNDLVIMPNGITGKVIACHESIAVCRTIHHGKLLPTRHTLLFDELQPATLEQKAQVAADCFCLQLTRVLDRYQLAEVIARNAKETDSSICHTHDFCDANEVMDDAFKPALGYRATDTAGETQVDCMSDECHEIFKLAWKLAKKNNFQPCY